MNLTPNGARCGGGGADGGGQQQRSLMEQWMATQQLPPLHPTYNASIAAATSAGDLSEKMVEMDTCQNPICRPIPQEENGGQRVAPSYMAATKSARAKVRAQGPAFAGKLQQRQQKMAGGETEDFISSGGVISGRSSGAVAAEWRGRYSPEWSVGGGDRTPPPPHGSVQERKMMYA
ncbi:hypothetical protein AXF42_Ash019354 [Apostasia shenzhenica]|uniref:DUF4005 domain-containing protein n=1 Tax=Apostasia shenzhenica TaxID=1088818 RepID=A0A2H9ZTJ8_9ASPA|nr:hypothetical protein AXF42_Ash019354 [Apostasia shenzhenica]